MIQMEKGKPLGEWEEAKVRYGVKTGRNNAFIITTAQREQILDECKNTTPFITKQTKQDINNKFCIVQGFEKEQESDIQKANDPKFTLKVIAILIIILFISFFVICLFGMFI